MTGSVIWQDQSAAASECPLAPGHGRLPTSSCAAEAVLLDAEAQLDNRRGAPGNYHGRGRPRAVVFWYPCLKDTNSPAIREVTMTENTMRRISSVVIRGIGLAVPAFAQQQPADQGRSPAIDNADAKLKQLTKDAQQTLAHRSEVVSQLLDSIAAKPSVSSVAVMCKVVFRLLL